MKNTGYNDSKTSSVWQKSHALVLRVYKMTRAFQRKNSLDSLRRCDEPPFRCQPTSLKGF